MIITLKGLQALKLVNCKAENLTLDQIEFDEPRKLKDNFTIAEDKRGSYGWVILKDGRPKYYVSIYEPQAYNTLGTVVSFIGHEELVQLDLLSGEWNKEYTR